jgi:hypothetical protein
MVLHNAPDKHEFAAVRELDAPRQGEFVGIVVDDLSSVNGDKQPRPFLKQSRQQPMKSGRFSLECLVGYNQIGKHGPSHLGKILRGQSLSDPLLHKMSAQTTVDRKRR